MDLRKTSKSEMVMYFICLNVDGISVKIFLKRSIDEMTAKVITKNQKLMLPI